MLKQKINNNKYDVFVRPTEKVSCKRATSGKNESSEMPDLAFPINVGLLHSYFY